MAFTLNDVQNLTNSKAVQVSDSVGTAINTVSTATKSAGSYVKDIAPATNRRVNSIAAELNAKLNNHDRELFKHQIMIEMVAQSTGVNLPADEVLNEYYEAEQKRIVEEAAQVKKEKETVKTDQELVDALTDPKVLTRLKAFLFGNEEEVKEVIEKEAPQLETKEELDEYMSGDSATIEEAKEAVAEKKPKVSTGVTEDTQAKNPEEWKQCVTCGTDISVMYKPSECPHCRRTKKAEEAKSEGGTKPRPRIRFEESSQK